ncbi:hypothetical protein K488DRAFT_85409 [Vararia minispora EC-137]|uniref:Uncharacterized protein n=1 Tax=Vararia minispora EC-137 TaxID=1314806 RepID=A0ACB8QMW0_9AGAM|nr:hypothetical protein K488DRAFT_85409 [Vararia minispora EC-137]
MSAHPSPGPSQAQPASTRKFALGLQQGAAEEKYRTKTKTLRKKIREIEAENDKVYAKTLQAKRNIQRLRIERA